jgi:hypothetical protein
LLVAFKHLVIVFVHSWQVCFEFDDITIAAEALTALTNHTLTFSVNWGGQSSKVTLLNLLLTDIFTVSPAFSYEDVSRPQASQAVPDVTPTAAGGTGNGDWRLAALARAGGTKREKSDGDESERDFAEKIAAEASAQAAAVAIMGDATVDPQLMLLMEDIQREWNVIDSEGENEDGSGAVEATTESSLPTAPDSVRGLLRSAEASSANTEKYRPLKLKPRSDDLPPPLPKFVPPGSKTTKEKKKQKQETQKESTSGKGNQFQALSEDGADVGSDSEQESEASDGKTNSGAGNDVGPATATQDLSSPSASRHSSGEEYLVVAAHGGSNPPGPQDFDHWHCAQCQAENSFPLKDLEQDIIPDHCTKCKQCGAVREVMTSSAAESWEVI